MVRAKRDLDLSEDELLARFVGWTFAAAYPVPDARAGTGKALDG
ncbi:hypothetical protein [Dactylosporangium sp. CS-033363]